MELEMNYLSEKIDKLEGQIDTIVINKKNFTTPLEINFYNIQLEGMGEEKEILENILNKLTEIVLTK